ncbi:21070_t:CDS:2, partial [Dentiscutata erythropus]
PRLSTLKEIKQWFIQGDKQKKNPSHWFSAQCQFDLILSINGFIGIVEYVLTNWPGVTIQPRRVSQDMLEGLFGTIREMGGDSSTQTVQSYGYTINKLTITMQMTSEIRSLNYVENANINCLQLERAQLIEWLLYQNGVEDLLVTWSKNIRQMALDSIPLKKMPNGGWFNDFQLLALDDIKVE